MRTNQFYDTWLFLIGQTNDHAITGVPWLMVAITWALLISSIWIARLNWVQDASQRTLYHVSNWIMRLLIAGMWLEGSLWKLPLPVSGGLSFWIGEETKHASFEIHKWLVTHVMIPALPVLNPVVFLIELGLAVSFALGILVRPMAALGMLFVLQLWFGLYRHPHEWPWSYVFLIFLQGQFLMHNAGRSLGLDALLVRNPWGPFKGDGAIAKLYARFA